MQNTLMSCYQLFGPMWSCIEEDPIGIFNCPFSHVDYGTNLTRAESNEIMLISKMVSCLANLGLQVKVS